MKLLACVSLVAALGSAEEDLIQPPSIDAQTCAKFVAPVENALQAQITELTSKQTLCATSVKESSELLKASQQQASTCQSKLGEFEVLTNNLKNELKTVEGTEQKLKELESVRAEVEVLRKSHGELGALKTANAELNQKVASVTQSLDTWKASHASAIAEVEQLRSKGSALESCEKSRQSYESELASVKAVNTRVLNENLQQMNAKEVEVALCKQNLADSTEKIYTAAQFWRSFQHSKQIGSAFLLFARNRVVKIVGPDTYELAKLQMQLWFTKGLKQASVVYTPLKMKIVKVYDAHMRVHVATAMERAALYAETPLQMIQDNFNAGLIGVERYMERVVTNLSDSTPSVREVFPDNFHDRCFAFAFISLIVFTVSNVTQWIFGTFITSPIYWLFGVSSNSKITGEKKTRPTKGKKNVATKAVNKAAGK